VTVGSAERRGVGIVFFLNGTVTGTFASRLPWIAQHLQLSSGLLGAVGLMTSIGALATMPFAAQFVHRYGPKAATRVLMAASSLALILPAFAPDVLALIAVMLVYGALLGTNDNAMNAQAVEAERRIGKSIMSGLHGLWSVGVLVGALVGSLSAHAGIDPRIQFPIVAVTAAGGGVLACALFVGGRPDGAAAEVAVPRFAWPHGILLLIGLVGFAAIFVEFAANDWSAIFMHWVLHANQAQAALATGVFAGSMAAGRLGGDALVRRIGPRLSVRTCGILGTAGCVLVAVTPSALVALAGFVLIGLGVSVVVPLVFAAAGRSGPSPAISVAGVATVSYGAGMAAPSVMGGVADLSSLRIAFGVAAVLATAIAVGAGLLDRQPATSGNDASEAEHEPTPPDQDDAGLRRRSA
jgi:MFS family permease